VLISVDESGRSEDDGHNLEVVLRSPGKLQIARLEGEVEKRARELDAEAVRIVESDEGFVLQIVTEEGGMRRTFQAKGILIETKIDEAGRPCVRARPDAAWRAKSVWDR
jgi:hypothetical protein